MYTKNADHVNQQVEHDHFCTHLATPPCSGSVHHPMMGAKTRRTAEQMIPNIKMRMYTQILL